MISSIAIVCTQVNGFKYCYLTLIILFATVKCFKYYDVILTIQVINHLFAHSEMISIIVIRPIVGTLTSITTPGQSKPRSNPYSPELEPHYQMRFSVISRTLEVGVLHFRRDAVGMVCSLSRQDWFSVM